MNATAFDKERSIARCRVILSVAVMVACWVNPSTGGAFALDRFWAIVLLAHLVYSLLLWWAHGSASSARLATIASFGDVFFTAAVATVTEGATSPFFSFFAFAVLTVGLRSGLWPALAVTSVSVALYLGLVFTLAPTDQHLLLAMRAVYIAITGYLVGYFGQASLKQEAVIRKLEADAQRTQIARSLHDGYVQALSGINLRLGSCQELLRRGRADEALAELGELQLGVNREHDELRAYIRSLIEHEETRTPPVAEDFAQVSVRAEFQGSAAFVEHVLSIMLEGVRNVRRHSRARSAAIVARMAAGELVLTIDDDGVGFRDEGEPSWSMVSRVADCGGRLTLPRDGRSGGHVLVELPVA